MQKFRVYAFYPDGRLNGYAEVMAASAGQAEELVESSLTPDDGDWFSCCTFIADGVDENGHEEYFGHFHDKWLELFGKDL